MAEISTESFSVPRSCLWEKEPKKKEQKWLQSISRIAKALNNNDTVGQTCFLSWYKKGT